MLRTMRFYASFLTSLATTMPLTIRTRKKIEELDSKNQTLEKYQLVHEISSKWVKRFIDLTGAKVTVHGTENLPKDGAVVFISNHQSNFDIPLLIYYLNKPKGFVAKQELSKVPMINQWIEFMGCVSIDRNNLRKSATAIIQGVKILKSGHSLVMFSEGTRSKGGPMSDFKPGSFKLATKAKVPIVPITIDGSYKLMEGNGYKIKPADINLYIHKPIYTNNLSKEDEANLPKKVQDIVASKLS